MRNDETASRPAPARSVIERLRRRYRLATAPGRSLPDFVILGAERAGTSSLFHYLAMHPQVAGSMDAEVHFFDHHYAAGERWYRSNFPRAARLSRDSRVGEVSPYYLYHPCAPARIRKLLPDAKLIALLREPVGRAISQYFHECHLGHETLPIGEALRAEDNRIAHVAHLPVDAQYKTRAHRSHAYRRRGLYAEQLQRYSALFPREHMLIVPSEKMFAEPQAVLREVFGFLGVDRDFLCEGLHPMNVARLKDDVPEAIRQELAAYFAEPNARLCDDLGWDPGW